MRHQKVTYNIDWLQVYCISAVDNTRYADLKGKMMTSTQANQYGNHNEYYFIEPREVIVGYQHIYQVVWKRFTIATIACVPRDAKKDSRGCAIKMANAVLYTQSWYYLLNDLAGAMGWRIHNLTRLDLCADFNHFWHGLQPQHFIKRYVMRNATGYIKMGTNKFTLNGERTEYSATFDTLRFGSRKSGVSAYLYNKSKELRDQHDKPWIRYTWEQAKLNPDKVWRLEFSINSSANELRDMETGLIHTLFHTDLELNESIKQYFLAYYQTYFQFKLIQPSKDGHGFIERRRMKTVDLFDPAAKTTLKPIHLNRSKDTGRIEKILSNRLANEYDYVMATDEPNKYQVAQSITDIRKHFDELYLLKKTAAKQEKQATDTLKHFSKAYIRERIRISYLRPQDYQMLSDVARSYAESKDVIDMLLAAKQDNNNPYLFNYLNRINYDYKNFQNSTNEREPIPKPSDRRDGEF